MAAPTAPADTTMMRIVHDALRRDLARATSALSGPAPASAARRRAIGTHLTWVMGFLHAHHTAEDHGLYPYVRERAGAVDRQVLDRMCRAHEAVAAVIGEVEAAAASLVADPSDEAAGRTVAALDALGDVLLPHLLEEETEAMPVVSRLITEAEWRAIDKEHNLDPKSTSQLGLEGHWIIDGASPSDRATVTGLVPPIPRCILLHGYARRYRRIADACWGPDRKPPRRVQLENHVEVVVDAAIDDVWEVVRDVTRIGEWSRECVGAEWLGGAARAVPGARFRGRNRAGVLRWGRQCEVVAADPYELVWRTVPTALYPDSSEWCVSLSEVDGGTRISQRYHVLRAPKVLTVLFAVLVPTHRDRTAELTDDLRRLGSAATRSSGRGDVDTAPGARARHAGEGR